MRKMMAKTTARNACTTACPDCSDSLVSARGRGCGTCDWTGMLVIEITEVL
jgi:hypothetical protein